MKTEKENSKNEQYIFNYENECFSDVITYMNNLVNKIKEDSNAKENAEIQAFPSEKVTGEKFEKFIKIAKAAGYTVYKVEKL